ncbi:MAG: hypothetical protein ACYCTE_14720 [Acidimicrobiales bacterium]
MTGTSPLAAIFASSPIAWSVGSWRSMPREVLHVPSVGFASGGDVPDR